MEWFIPIQRLEVGKIHVGGLVRGIKPLAPLAYMDGSLFLPNLNILLPVLRVSEYDSETGKLQLDVSDSLQTGSKLLALQETLLGAVFLKQQEWFGTNDWSLEHLHALFQPFLDRNTLHLYCPQQAAASGSGGAAANNERRNNHSFIEIWKDGVWHKGMQPGLLTKGSLCRIALRLQGISFQNHAVSGKWTGRFRIQHRIVSILHVPAAALKSSAAELKYLLPLDSKRY